MSIQIRLDIISRTLNEHPELKVDSDILKALFAVEHEVTKFERVLSEKVGNNEVSV